MSKQNKAQELLAQAEEANYARAIKECENAAKKGDTSVMLGAEFMSNRTIFRLRAEGFVVKECPNHSEVSWRKAERIPTPLLDAIMFGKLHMPEFKWNPLTLSEEAALDIAAFSSALLKEKIKEIPLCDIPAAAQAETQRKVQLLVDNVKLAKHMVGEVQKLGLFSNFEAGVVNECFSHIDGFVTNAVIRTKELNDNGTYKHNI